MIFATENIFEEMKHVSQNRDLQITSINIKLKIFSKSLDKAIF